jgi:hypothetical protein
MTHTAPTVDFIRQDIETNKGNVINACFIRSFLGFLQTNIPLEEIQNLVHTVYLEKSADTRWQNGFYACKKAQRLEALQKKKDDTPKNMTEDEQLELLFLNYDYEQSFPKDELVENPKQQYEKSLPQENPIENIFQKAFDEELFDNTLKDFTALKNTGQINFSMAQLIFNCLMIKRDTPQGEIMMDLKENRYHQQVFNDIINFLLEKIDPCGTKVAVASTKPSAVSEQTRSLIICGKHDHDTHSHSWINQDELGIIANQKNGTHLDEAVDLAQYIENFIILASKYSGKIDFKNTVYTQQIKLIQDCVTKYKDTEQALVKENTEALVKENTEALVKENTEALPWGALALVIEAFPFMSAEDAENQKTFVENITKEMIEGYHDFISLDPAQDFYLTVPNIKGGNSYFLLNKIFVHEHNMQNGHFYFYALLSENNQKEWYLINDSKLSKLNYINKDYVFSEVNNKNDVIKESSLCKLKPLIPQCTILSLKKIYSQVSQEEYEQFIANLPK